MDCSLSGSSALGILQARILEWVTIPFSRGPSWPRDVTQVSLIAGGFFTNSATREAQEYWSGYPILSPGDLIFKILQSLFCGVVYSLFGEGNGTLLQYSCLENPMVEEPGGLQSMGSLRVGHDWATSLSCFTFMHWRRKWQPTPVFLPGEPQELRSLVGCHLWGCTESDTTEVT